MKAVLLKGTGGVNQLSVEEVPQPSIKDDELLIKTKAFSINPIEVKTRKGNRFSEKLLKDKPSILGWDASGVVEKTGNKIDQFSVGDKVFGIIGFPEFGKTYAEYIVAKAQDIVHMPKNADYAETAVSTIAAITAYQSLKHFGKLKPGTKALIHAASGGVGHFGVQIAKHLGAEVWATASANKHAFVKELGADHIIDYNKENFKDVVSGMDVVYDLIGGPYIDRSLKTLKKGGTIISIPSATNEEVEEKAKASGCKGVRFIMKADQKDLKAIADLIEQDIIKPHVSKQFTLNEIRQAHAALEEGHTKGKIAVLTE